MTDHLALIARLCGLLAAENEALRQMDLPGAAALVVQKQEVAAALAEAGPTVPKDAVADVALRAQLAQLLVLAEQNRSLLELGLSVQAKVLSLVAQSARDGAASRRYGRSGSYAGMRDTGITLSSRA